MNKQSFGETTNRQAPTVPPLKLFKAMDMRFSPFHDEDPDTSPLLQSGVVYVTDPHDCDIYVTKVLEPLKPLIRAHGSRKQYLLWNSEPRGDLHFTNRFSFTNLLPFRRVDVHVMNAYTGDIWINNYCVLTPQHWIEHRNPIGSQTGFSRPNAKKVVALLGYRNHPKQWHLRHKGAEIDLSYLRTQIALQGYQTGKADVYGTDWPAGIALEDSRSDTNWRDRKQAILQGYSFNLALENTNIDYYCTEKIWDSIYAGCLPIYYGRGNKIYEDFPQDSFLDYAEFATPNALFAYIEAMPFTEFQERFLTCFAVCKRLIDKKFRNGVNTVQAARVRNIVDQLHLMVNEYGR